MNDAVREGGHEIVTVPPLAMHSHHSTRSPRWSEGTGHSAATT